MSAAASRPGRSSRGSRRAAWEPCRLTESELAAVIAGLQTLVRRLDGFGERLDALEEAIQSRSGSTTRSTRDSRSLKRSRSS